MLLQTMCDYSLLEPDGQPKRLYLQRLRIIMLVQIEQIYMRLVCITDLRLLVHHISIYHQQTNNLYFSLKNYVRKNTYPVYCLTLI